MTVNDGYQVLVYYLPQPAAAAISCAPYGRGGGAGNVLNGVVGGGGGPQPGGSPLPSFW